MFQSPLSGTVSNGAGIRVHGARHNRRLFAVMLMAALMVLSAVAITSDSAETDADDPVTFIIGDLKYTVTGTDTVSVEAKDTSISGAVRIPVYVEYEDKEYEVTSTPGNAFQGCHYITKVYLPDSDVFVLGGNTFISCNSLEYVLISKKVTVIPQGCFGGDPVLKEVEFGTGSELQTIEYRAFNGDTALVDLVLPDTVTTIRANAFSGVTNIGLCGTNVIWCYDGNGTLTISGNGAMNNYASSDNCPYDSYKTGITKVIVKDGVTSIGDRAFANYSNLKDIIIHSTVTSIGNAAFYTSGVECIDLSCVETIVLDAFYGCSSLKNVTFGTKAKTIGSRAFQGTGITAVELTADSLGDAAFKSCIKLVTASLTYTGDNKELNAAAFSGCYGLVAVTISGNVITLKADCFLSCGSLVSVTLPSTVKDIYSAFGNCSSLCEIALPSSLKTLNNNAFSGCTNLREITLPASVNNVAALAFISSGLEKITVESGNATYSSSDGVLYNKAGNTLVIFPNGREGSFTLPAGVTTVGNYVFYNNCIGSLDLTGLTSLGAANFNGCSNLHTIKFGNLSSCMDNPSVEFYDGYGGNALTNKGNATTNAANIKNLTFIGSNSKYYKSTNTGGYVFVDGKFTPVTDYYEGSGTIQLGTGSSCVITQTEASSIVIPSSWGMSGTEKRVTGIGSNAFAGCSSLTYLEIPDTVTTVPATAFDSSMKFYDLEGPDSYSSVPEPGYIYSMHGNKLYGVSHTGGQLANGAYLIIEGAVVALGSGEYTTNGSEAGVGGGSSAISSITSWGDVVIPEYWMIGGQKYTVTAVNNSAFRGITGMTSVTGPDTVKTIGYSSFNKNGSACAVFNGAETIEYSVFYESSLTAADFPSAKQVGSTCFSRSNSLKTVDLPLVTNLSNRCFEHSYNLEVINAPLVKTIDIRAVSGCDNLKRVNSKLDGECILNHLTSIAAECTFLGTGSKITYVEMNAIKTLPTDSSALYLRSNIKSVSMDSLTALPGDSMWSGKASLEAVSLASIKTVNTGTFSNCPKLTSVTLSSWGVTIGAQAFNNDKALTSLNGTGIINLVGVDKVSGKAFAIDSIGDAPELYIRTPISHTLVCEIVDISGSTYGPFSYVKIASLGQETVSSNRDLTVDLRDLSLVRNCFRAAALFETVKLGNNSALTDYCFYQCSSLKNLDLCGNAFTANIGCTSSVKYMYNGTVSILRSDSLSAATPIYIGTARTLDEAKYDDGLIDLSYLTSSATNWMNVSNSNVTNFIINKSEYIGGVNNFGDKAFLNGFPNLESLTILELTDASYTHINGKLKDIASDNVDLVIKSIKNDAALGANAFTNLNKNLKSVSFECPVALANFAMKNSNVLSMTFDEVTSWAECTDGMANAKTKSVTIKSLPSGLVPAYAFYKFTALESVNIPDMTSIGAYSFSECSALESINGTDIDLSNVTTIGSFAFYKAVETSGAVVKIGASTVTIGHQAFRASNIKELTSTTPVSVSTGDLAFASSTIVSVGDDISFSAIGGSCFTLCSKIQGTVNLGPSCTVIPNKAFNGCGKLQVLGGCEEITEIQTDALAGCTKFDHLEGCTKLTTIYEGIFKDKQYFTQAVFPSLTVIRDNEFSGCSALATVSIPAVSVGMNAFLNCISLQSIDLTTCTNYESIGENAFSGCSALKTVDVYSLRVLDDYAFSGAGATDLKVTVTLDSSLTGEAVFKNSGLKTLGKTGTADGTVSIPEVDNIPLESFKGCGMSVVSAAKATAIGASVFEGCTSLTRADFSTSSDVSIGDDAFKGAGAVSGMSISGKISSIGASAFNASKVSRINSTVNGEAILSDVITIGNEAFRSNTLITSVQAPSCITVGDYAFYETVMSYFDSTPSLGYASGLLRMLNGFEIGDYAFVRTSINAIELDGPNDNSTPMTIGAGAFQGTGVKEIFIPEGVPSIEAYVFKDCVDLTDVYAASTVSSIDTSAFYNTAKGMQLNLYLFEDANDASSVSFVCTDSYKPNINVIVHSAFSDTVMKTKIQAYVNSYTLSSTTRSSVVVKYGTSVQEYRYALNGVKFKLPYVLNGVGVRETVDDFGIAKLTLGNQDDTTKFLKVGSSGDTFVAYLSKYGSGEFYGSVTLWDKSKITGLGRSLVDSFDLKVDSYKMTVDGIEYTMDATPKIDGTYTYGQTLSFTPLVSTPSGLSKFYYVSSASNIKYPDNKNVTVNIAFVDDTFTLELQPSPINVIWKNYDGAVVRTETAKYIEGEQISWSGDTPIRAGYKFTNWMVTSGTVKTPPGITIFGGEGVPDTYTIAGRQSLEITAQFAPEAYTFQVKVDGAEGVYKEIPVTGPYTVTKNADNTLQVKWTAVDGSIKTEIVGLPTFKFGYKFSNYICADNTSLTERTFYESTYVTVTSTPQPYNITYYSEYDGTDPSKEAPFTFKVDGETVSSGDSKTYWFNTASSFKPVVDNATGMVYSGYKVGGSTTKISGYPTIDQSVFKSSTSSTITLVFSDPSYYVWYDCDNDDGQIIKSDVNRYTVGNKVSINDHSSIITSKYGYTLVLAKWTYTYGSETREISGFEFTFDSDMAEIADANDYVFTLTAVWKASEIKVQYTTGSASASYWIDYLAEEYPSTTKIWTASVKSGDSQAAFNSTGKCSDRAYIDAAFTPSITNVKWAGFNTTGSWEIHKPNGESTKFTGSFTLQSADDLKMYDMDETDGYEIWVSPVFEYVIYGVMYDISPATGSVTDNRDYRVGNTITLKTKDDVPQYPDHTFVAWRHNGETMSVQYPVTQDTITEVNAQNKYEFTATWEETKYWVSYDLNGGKGASVPTEPATGYYTQTSPYTLPSSSGYTKEGFICAGWGFGNIALSVAPTVISDISSHADKNGYITLNLVWTPSSYNIEYSLDGGLISADAPTIGYYDAETEIPYPTKSGYTFNGWTSADAYSGAMYLVAGEYHNWIGPSTNMAKSEYFKNLALANGTVHLTANWSPVSYTIVYNLGGGDGTVPAQQTVWVDQVLDLADYSGYTMLGYEPSGWSVNGSDYVKTGDKFSAYIAGFADNNRVVTLYLLWSPARYSVVLDEDNGGSSKTLSAYYGLQVPVGTPVKGGYVFKGWLAETTITSSNAQCSPDGVAWYGWDGTELTDCKYFKNLSNVKDSEVKLKAYWEKEQYTIMFDLAGGTGTTPSDIIATIGDPLTDLPSVAGIINTGYTASGWTIDGTGIITSSTEFTTYHASFANESRVLTASVKWVPIQYKVEVDNGVSTNVMTYSYGDTISLGKPVKTGSVFKGWKLDTPLVSSSLYSADGEAWFGWDGTTTSYTYFKNLATTDSTVKMSAQWSLDEYVLVYDLDGGSGTAPKEQVIHIGDRITLPSYDQYSKGGYTASGWSLDGSTILQNGEEFTSTYARFADGNKSVIVKMVWSPISYNVEYSDGTHTSTTTAYFDEVINLGMPTNAGYVFAGWKSSGSTLAPSAMASRDGVLWSTWNGDATISTYFKGLSQGQDSTVVIEAEWKSDSFTIKYNTNGGMGTPPVDENVYQVDDPVTLVTDVTFTKTGADFAGWSYDKNASSPIEITKFTLDLVPLTDDFNQLTLYAVWVSGMYTVTIDIGDATPSSVPEGWTAQGGGKYTKLFEANTETKDVVSQWDGITLSMDDCVFDSWQYTHSKVTTDFTITAVYKQIIKNGVFIVGGIVVLIAIIILAITRIERR